MTSSFSKAFGVVYTNWLCQLHFVLMFNLGIAVKKKKAIFSLILAIIERGKENCVSPLWLG